LVLSGVLFLLFLRVQSVLKLVGPGKVEDMLFYSFVISGW